MDVQNSAALAFFASLGAKKVGGLTAAIQNGSKRLKLDAFYAELKVFNSIHLRSLVVFSIQHTVIYSIDF